MFKYLKIAASPVLLSSLAFSIESTEPIVDHSNLHVQPDVAIHAPQAEGDHQHKRRYTLISDKKRESKILLKADPRYKKKDPVSHATGAAKLPAVMDLRKYCPAVYDQGYLGSCTGNAIAGAMEMNMMYKNRNIHYTPSRLFIYYNERALEGSVNEDAGASISDGIYSVCTTGACRESLWTYDDGPTKFIVRPTQNCYVDAKNCVDLDNLRLARLRQDRTSLKSVLAAGKPFVFGFLVYSSFESDTVARTGIVPMPGKHEELLGGHAVTAVGYNTTHFLVRNSWGTGWGLGGYFWMPYAYLTSPELSSDFWKITKIGKKNVTKK